MEFEYVTDKELKETLVDFIVPFVNAEPNDAVTIFVDRFGASQELPDWTEELLEQGAFIPHLAKSDLRKRVLEIMKLQEIAKNMLSIALHGIQGRPIPKIVEGKIPQIEDFINIAVARNRSRAHWRGSEGNFVLHLPAQSFDAFRFVQSMTVSIVVVAFEMKVGIDRKIIKKGIGFDSVGLCPNCGVFFGKKRKDQLYCSEVCGGTARSKKSKQLRKI
ncbi:MAG: hypothetical protein PHV05_04195 [Candidatus Riflebacteria bacterium]|nr:hypothetical protein [Candidatus Riflebacteria bacterium]